MLLQFSWGEKKEKRLLYVTAGFCKFSHCNSKFSCLVAAVRSSILRRPARLAGRQARLARHSWRLDCQSPQIKRRRVPHAPHASSHVSQPSKVQCLSRHTPSRLAERRWLKLTKVCATASAPRLTKTRHTPRSVAAGRRAATARICMESTSRACPEAVQCHLPSLVSDTRRTPRHTPRINTLDLHVHALEACSAVSPEPNV